MIRRCPWVDLRKPDYVDYHDAHMQATGMVNDHSTDCFRRGEIIELYKL